MIIDTRQALLLLMSSLIEDDETVVLDSGTGVLIYLHSSIGRSAPYLFVLHGHHGSESRLVGHSVAVMTKSSIG